MKTCYFTFGIGQRHPVTLESLYKKAVKITAIDENFCREAMFKMFGPKWSMQYSEENFKSSDILKDYEIYLNITVNIV